MIKRKTAAVDVAIFGAGKMGTHHAKTIQRVKKGRLVAVADPAVDIAEMQKTLPPEVALFDDPLELLKKIRPHVVHITTPPISHVPLAKMAIEHGAHVYVEKPVALKLDDAEMLLQLAQKSKLKVCAGHQLLFEYSALKADEWLPIIGDIVHIESYFSFRPVRRNITPIDQLLDILPHPVYLLERFLNDGTIEQPLKIHSVHADPRGECRAILTRGSATGSLVVSLRARPVESYLRITGTNGSITADFVLGSVRFLPGPGASAPAVIINPFKMAEQTVRGTVKGLFRRLFVDRGGYPGLQQLIEAFYNSILTSKPCPISTESIRDTVHVIDVVDAQLRQAHRVREQLAEKAYLTAEQSLGARDMTRGGVMVTGGTGFLGRKVLTMLIGCGRSVRCLARRVPSFAERVPGVEYRVCDLGQAIEPDAFDDIETIVHCAAETAGNLKDHERNSVTATRNLYEGAHQNGIQRFIHISSVAVLKAGSNEVHGLSEASPLDYGNLARGPYVWGKAEAERLLNTANGRTTGLSAKIIRLAPLVDLESFQAPGRLGREIGQRFVAVGNRHDRIGLCDVLTAAKVIRYYVEDFTSAPSVVNLVQPDAPTRGELVQRLLAVRPDLKASWLPMPILKTLSPLLVALQRIVFPRRTPLDIYSAFASQRYDTSLAAAVIAKATLA